MAQNIPLAVGLQVIGSFCFALSAHLQNSAVMGEVSDAEEKKRLSSRQLWKSIRSPRWMLGLALLGVSLLCQITALVFAPVSVVQPVGLLAFPWSMLLQAYSAHQRIHRKVLGAMLFTVAATFGFTVLVSFNAAPDRDLIVWKVIVGALVVYAIAGSLGRIGAHGPKAWRSLAWASGGAMFYGLEAALVKSLIHFVGTHEWWADPAFWAIVVLLVVGSATAGWMIQQGYATGPAELVVASMTITSPVVAVAFGIAVLGEGANFSVLVGIAVLLLGLVAVAGVIMLTHVHKGFDK